MSSSWLRWAWRESGDVIKAVAITWWTIVLVFAMLVGYIFGIAWLHEQVGIWLAVVVSIPTFPILLAAIILQVTVMGEFWEEIRYR